MGKRDNYIRGKGVHGDLLAGSSRKLDPPSPAPQTHTQTHTHMPPLQEILDMPREEYEKDLQFAGFIAFHCLLRKDSGVVIKVDRERRKGRKRMKCQRKKRGAERVD